MLNQEPRIEPETIGRAVTPISPRPKPRRHSLINALVGLAFLTVVSALAFGAYWQLRRANALQQEDSVFVEIKVIDQAGQPVVGAKVFEADLLVGQTDSFGEWTKFSRYELGHTITYRITSRHTGRLLEATKNFAMPLKATSQVHFQTILQLKDPAQDGAVKVVEDSAVAASADSPETRQKEPGGPNMDAASMSNGETQASQPDAAPAQGKLEIVDDPNLTGAAAERHGALRSEVMPKLLQYFAEQKMQEKFAGKISLQVLASPQGDPLVVIRRVVTEGKVENAALRTLGADHSQTLAILKSAIEWVVEKPGVPPRPNWQRQQLQLLGTLDGRDEVYVGGHLTAPLPGKQKFEYFGETMKAMNVTVLNGNTVAARGRIVNRGPQNAAAFSLPAANVSIRH